ncbi:hypothetical protein BBN09_10705 [Vibrio parahaemolyticus]|jgi:hypothetical protein|uniref:hypothetical protein n=1 Tax=Vibrio parahaemolyticus TaxID=670 RepID=UPI00084A7B08|nr:hypothetical protein [Vibrio parahaemolyticus]OEB90900.1 hypothetical protein BBN09_10705 [Vibrio parahaemolyticus]
MKHLLLIVPALCLSASTLAKVTVEDAIESNRPYAEANGSVHIPPDIEGIGPDEFDPDAPENGEFGIWAKFTGNPYGLSSIMLQGDPIGQKCSPKGAYGSWTYEECTHVGNGDFDCDNITSFYECE